MADALTPRQLEAICALVSEGSVKGAAHRLGVAGWTVGYHVREACERVGVETPIQAAVALALRGELSIPS